MPDDPVVAIEDGELRRIELHQHEPVVIGRDPRRRGERPSIDEPPEPAIGAVHLDPGVRPIAHVELRVAAPQVRVHEVTGLEPAGALGAVERSLIRTVRRETVHQALAVPVGDPDVAAAGDDRHGGRPVRGTIAICGVIGTGEAL